MGGIDLSKFKQRQAEQKAAAQKAKANDKAQKAPTPVSHKAIAYMAKIVRLVEAEREIHKPPTWSLRNKLAQLQFHGVRAMAWKKGFSLKRIAHHEYRLAPKNQAWLVKLWPGDSKHVLGDLPDHIEGPLPFGSQCREDWTLLEVVKAIIDACKKGNA